MEREERKRHEGQCQEDQKGKLGEGVANEQCASVKFYNVTI